MERIEIWKKIREVCSFLNWCIVIIELLALFFDVLSKIAWACFFVSLALFVTYLVCDIVYTKKLRALIKKEWGEDGLR